MEVAVSISRSGNEELLSYNDVHTKVHLDNVPLKAALAAYQATTIPERAIDFCHIISYKNNNW